MNSINELIGKFKEAMNRHHFTFDPPYKYKLDNEIINCQKQFEDEIKEAFVAGFNSSNDSEYYEPSYSELKKISNAADYYFEKTFKK
jgi:hypothetical protein